MQKKIDKPSENIEPRSNSGIRSLRHQAESELAEQEQTARPVDVSDLLRGVTRNSPLTLQIVGDINAN